jgi:hypothetical protein
MQQTVINRNTNSSTSKVGTKAANVNHFKKLETVKAAPKAVSASAMGAKQQAMQDEQAWVMCFLAAAHRDSVKHVINLVSHLAGMGLTIHTIRVGDSNSGSQKTYSLLGLASMLSATKVCSYLFSSGLTHP